MANGSPAKRFILIGLDGVGMENMLHMVETGHCPNVQKLVERGVYREVGACCPPSRRRAGQRW